MTVTSQVIEAARRRGVDVLTQAQWGAQHGSVYERRRIETHRHSLLPSRAVRWVFGHITVTLDHGPLTGDFKADVRTVERIGFERFKSGISYNWVVDMATGQVAAGMPLDAKGTHTVNAKGTPGFPHDLNALGIAIAFLGMPGDRLSPAAERAVAGLLAAHVEVDAVVIEFLFLPHSMFAAKDCPTDAVRNRLNAMRSASLDQLEDEVTPEERKLIAQEVVRELMATHVDDRKTMTVRAALRQAGGTRWAVRVLAKMLGKPFPEDRPKA